MEVKLILLAILVILFIFAWLISKSGLSKRIKMTGTFFLFTNLALFISSIVGFFLTIVMGEDILNTHVFEIVLIPALFAFVLTGISTKKENAEELYDEKQSSDMKDAASFSWMFVIITTFILYAMYSAGNIVGLIFFPIILFVAFASYAGSLLFFYKMR